MKRSSLTVFDEAAYCSEDLIDAVEPFSTQSSDSKYGKNTAKLQGLLPSQPPNQIIYASSQDTLDAVFYKRYKEYAKYMLAGDFRYFVCDMPCDTAITMYSKGEVIPPLLSQDVVDKAMRDDPETARKEYYNKPDMTGGDDQIVKWYTIRKNERQIVPYQEWREDNRIVLAFDPARTTDNSVMSVMNVYEDPEYGLCGDIIGCNNFIDIATKKKYKLDSNRQLEEIRNILLAYNGDNLDYEYIDSLLIDSGSGGGGQSTYADQLLNDWVDINGKTHAGLIDADNELYTTYKRRYPNAINKLRLISPRKYRTQMVEEFIELMELGVLRFPCAYSGSDILHLVKGTQVVGKDEDGNEIKEELTETYNLSQDEKIQLTQIDFMKREIAAIHKSTNAENTSVTYALAKEKANKMHKQVVHITE